MSHPSVPNDADDGIEAYIRSDHYDEDLGAARRMWSSEGVMEVAGSVVLLTYFSLPSLLGVRPVESTRFSGLIDGRLEREFLRTFLGLSGNAEEAGIRDAGTRGAIRHLSARHLEYAGMDGAYMEFISGLLMVAPLQVRDTMGMRRQADDTAYWRYMSHAMTLLRARFGARVEVESMCREFVMKHAGVSDVGRAMIRGYADRHPRHVALALPMVLPGAREVAESAVSDVLTSAGGQLSETTLAQQMSGEG